MGRGVLVFGNARMCGSAFRTSSFHRHPALHTSGSELVESKALLVTEQAGQMSLIVRRGASVCRTEVRWPSATGCVRW